MLGVFLLPYVLIRQPEMPSGTSQRSPEYGYDSARLLVDRTLWDSKGQRHLLEHEIFRSILSEIEKADTFIIADFFLWNPWKGAVGEDTELRGLSSELAQALIEKRIKNPDMPILVITDPINRVYGEDYPVFYGRMSQAGIPVIFTDLERLPDSNRIYGPQAKFWGHFFQPDTGPDAMRYFPNPFNPDGPRLSVGQLSSLLYFKANHRKVLVTGRNGGRFRALVGSFNPADGSANHSNVAALVEGPVAAYAGRSEMAIAGWSTGSGENSQMPEEHFRKTLSQLDVILPQADELGTVRTGAPSVSWFSEGQVREALVDVLGQCGAGARIDIGLFYFSDRKVVSALREAVERGSRLRLLLDANRDAFGREKSGIPNRQVAAELMQLASTHEIEVRWASTHGEQYHAKVLRVSGAGLDLICLGSSNWTRRNIGDSNLEANLLFRRAGSLGEAYDLYFDKVWNNTDGYTESQPYEEWAESGWTLRWKTWLYRFQEWSGASTF